MLYLDLKEHPQHAGNYHFHCASTFLMAAGCFVEHILNSPVLSQLEVLVLCLNVRTRVEQEDRIRFGYHFMTFHVACVFLICNSPA